MGEAFEKFLAIPTAQKAALFGALMVGAAAAWYFLFFEETQAAIQTASAKTPALAKQLASEQDIAKNLAKFTAEIEELKRVRDEMRDRLPDKAEIADLLQKIHGQAKIVGLEIARFERAKTELAALYARIPVKMTLEGDFNQITTFFYYLGKLTRIVNVENIKLTVVEHPAKGRFLRAACTASTFQYLAPGTTVEGAK